MEVTQPVSGAPWDALQGKKVLEISQFISGPYAASLLGSFGADVIKVEALDGDPNRDGEPRIQEVSATFVAWNCQKRFIAVDLKNPKSRELMNRLIAQSDVLIQNLRPGTVEKLGLDAASAHKINPRLVHCSIRAFYPKLGPLPGMDVLLQAESGIMDMTGEPGTPPTRVPLSLLDYTASMWAAFSVCAALHGKRHNLALQVNLLDVAMSLIGNQVNNYLASGKEPGRQGSKRPYITPHGVFPTSDGMLIVAAGTDRMFKALAPLLGPTIADDPRFTKLADRLKHRDELEEKMNAVLRTDTSERWYERLQEAGVQVAVIRSMGDAVKRHRNLSPTGFRSTGKGDVLAPPVEVQGAPWQVTKEARRIGHDTALVLAEVGFSQAEIEGMAAQGVVIT